MVNTNPASAAVLNSNESVKPVENSFKLPPSARRVVKIASSIARSALFGYGVYGMTCLLRKAGFLANIDKALTQPLSFVLLGAFSTGFIEVARLVNDLALYCLGDRQAIEALNPKMASSFNQLQRHTWKVIGKIEGILNKVDQVFSNNFKIRTAQQIKAQEIAEEDLNFMEISRLALVVQIQDTIQASIPQEAGLYCVEALGYKVLAAHVFMWLHVVGFCLGIVHRVSLVYQKKDQRELEQQQKEQQKEEQVIQNKA